MTIGSEGTVLNPVTSNNPISSNPIAPTVGRQGEYLVSELRGKYGTAAINKALFTFLATALTVPVVANNLVSVFALYNPPASGVLAELVDTEIGQVLATTVVDAVGWYFSPADKTSAATFTTRAVALTNYFSARVGDTPNGAVIPYTALTHSGTPVRVDIIASFGAVTDPIALGGNGAGGKLYDGRLWLPPGIAMSVAMSTAAGTSSGLDLSARWIEWPFA